MYALSSAEDAHPEVKEVQPHLASFLLQDDLERTRAVLEAQSGGRGGVVRTGEIGDLLTGHTPALGFVDAAHTRIGGVVKS